MSDPDQSLASLQDWLFASLTHPDQTEPALVERVLAPSPRQSARARLAVYQRSYILRLQTCLAEQFPALCHALGEGLFIDFAREYLRARPSSSHSLYQLGDGFADWLEANRPDHEQPASAREPWIDFMVDLARYEHALFQLYDAPGHEGRAWPTPDCDDARLVLQPCFALCTARYPVAWYYHEVSQGRAPQLPLRQDAYVAIVRKDYLTRSFPITAVHEQFLRTLQRTADLPRAMAELARALDRPLADAHQSWTKEVRGRWLEAGFFIERDALRETGSGGPRRL